MYLLGRYRALPAQKIEELLQRGGITCVDPLPPRTMA